MVPSEDRVGVCLVRVWLERDGGLRARVTAATDLHDEERVLTTTSRQADVLDDVSIFLAPFEAAREPPDPVA